MDVRIERLLREVSGLDAPCLGPVPVEMAVRSRLAHHRLDDIDAYWTLLSHAAEERQALVEAVVVPETWFFRDPNAFAALRKLAEAWRQQPSRPPLSALSLACSTGEEAYSIAITLLDAGFSPEQFRVDGVDISAQALERGRFGIYGARSFRGHHECVRPPYFVTAGDGQREVAAAPRSAVRFIQGNVTAREFLAGGGEYDVIFCRHLLIYFDAPTQRRAIATLDRLLAPHGTLFVAPAEAYVVRQAGFEFANLSLASAFCRPPSTSERDRSQPATRGAARRLERPEVVANEARLARPARLIEDVPTTRLPVAAPPAPAPSLPPFELSLAEARRHADAGDLAVCERACERLLRRDGASADILYLMAVVRDARGDVAGALACYRQVLYLNPDHSEALAHVALLAARTGDLRKARQFQDRARRAHGRDEKPDRVQRKVV